MGNIGLEGALDKIILQFGCLLLYDHGTLLPGTVFDPEAFEKALYTVHKTTPIATLTAFSQQLEGRIQEGNIDVHDIIDQLFFRWERDKDPWFMFGDRYGFLHGHLRTLYPCPGRVEAYCAQITEEEYDVLLRLREVYQQECQKQPKGVGRILRRSKYRE